MMSSDRTRAAARRSRTQSGAPFGRHAFFASLAALSLFATAMVSGDAPDTPRTEAEGLVAEAGFIGRLLDWVEDMLGGPVADDPPVQEDVW